MRRSLLSISAAALAIAALPALADPGKDDRGPKWNGQSATIRDASKGLEQKGGQKGPGRDQTKEWKKNQEKAWREATKDRKDDIERRAEREWSDSRRWEARRDEWNRDDRGDGIIDRVISQSRSERDDWRRPEKRDFQDNPFEIAERGRSFGFRDVDRYRYYNGCPPGLAKKRNGCQPPGQAKKRDYDRYWNRVGRWNDDNHRYYRDGYLLSYDQSDNLLGYLPLLGGALSVGSLFPSGYASQPVSDYRARFYGGGNDDYVYRYSDGVIYGLDSSDSAIRQVAGLLTGDDFTVGQPMPSGYSVYNVPYDYRDRYVDGPKANYRYSDGYVYRVDPTTQLVQAAIQLLS